MKTSTMTPLIITLLRSRCTVMTPYQVSSEIYGGFFYSGITLKWTTPKTNNPEKYYLIFLAASINRLHITSAYVYPVQPLATILNSFKS